jgi:uridine phosphorylase
VRTWTTDAPYRETPAQVARRRAEGCRAVEMEAAALFAVAAFRGVRFGQLLYAGDDVSGDEWRHRDWIRQAETRALMVRIALDAVRRLDA